MAAFFCAHFRARQDKFMSNQGIDIQHPKLRGEWAELRFMARAAEHGLRVSKPFGDCARYDVAVEAGGRFLRVQVKSVGRNPEYGYRCNLITAAGPYTAKDMDFVAIYVIHLELWYIIPGKAFEGHSSVKLYPDNQRSKFDKYKEAWDLLCGEPAPPESAAAGEAAPGDEETPAPPRRHPEATLHPGHPMSYAEARMLKIRDHLRSNPYLKRGR